jgi:phage portal protein BeeE
MGMIITDGMKTYNLKNPDSWGEWLANGSESVTATKLYNTVAMLNRCIRLRTDAAAHIPFALRKEKKDVTTSDDWNDPTGILPSPRRFLRQMEGAMLFSNAAYAWKKSNGFKVVKGLQFFAPHNTTPQFNPLTGELLHFQRPDRIYLPDEVLSVWYQDGVTEVGPSPSTIVGAAASAAGVLHYLDQFTTSYFQRGAIRVTILGMPQGTSEQTKNEVDSFFRRAYTGIKNAFTVKAINSDAIKPTIIGDGVDGLANNALTQQNREDIATAFGVPMSMVMSNAANFATAQQDERNLIQWAVLPDCELLAEELTRQVYEQRGYTFEFRPETMESFQEDEVNRAGAFASYVSAGIKRSIAAQMVGVELPADIEYEDLDPDEPPAPEPAPDVTPTPQPEQLQAQPMPEEVVKELAIWKRKATKAIKAGGNANVPFEVISIAPDMAAAVRGKLAGAKTLEDVREAFEIDAPPMVNAVSDDWLMIYDELKRANDGLEKSMAIVPEKPAASVNINFDQEKVIETVNDNSLAVLEAIKVLASAMMTSNNAKEIVIPAPVVNVEAAIIPAPIVNVAAPVVNVNVDPTPIVVNNTIQPGSDPINLLVQRDHSGNITGIKEK